MDQIQIGKFIASERKAHSLTQQQLADMLNISNKTVSKWECGKGLPDVSMLRPLCQALELDLNELLAGKHLDASGRQKQAEENVLRLLAEQKAQKHSKMRLLYGAVVMSALSMVIVIVLIGVYTEIIPVPVKVFLTAFFGGTMGLAIFLMLYQEHALLHYRCTKCDTVFAPRLLPLMLAPRRVRSRWLKCPHCGKIVRCEPEYGESSQNSVSCS